MYGKYFPLIPFQQFIKNTRVVPLKDELIIEFNREQQLPNFTKMDPILFTEVHPSGFLTSPGNRYRLTPCIHKILYLKYCLPNNKGQLKNVRCKIKGEKTRWIYSNKI